MHAHRISNARSKCADISRINGSAILTYERSDDRTIVLDRSYYYCTHIRRTGCSIRAAHLRRTAAAPPQSFDRLAKAKWLSDSLAHGTMAHNGLACIITIEKAWLPPNPQPSAVQHRLRYTCRCLRLTSSLTTNASRSAQPECIVYEC